MKDVEDLRRRALEQSRTGNYWASKTLALIDENRKLQARIDHRANLENPRLKEIIDQLDREGVEWEYIDLTDQMKAN
jgi:hypothetical protein